MANYYYNGVLLPEIPVKEGYIYTFIHEYFDWDIYDTCYVVYYSSTLVRNDAEASGYMDLRQAQSASFITMTTTESTKFVSGWEDEETHNSDKFVTTSNTDEDKLLWTRYMILGSYGGMNGTLPIPEAGYKKYAYNDHIIIEVPNVPDEPYGYIIYKTGSSSYTYDYVTSSVKLYVNNNMLRVSDSGTVSVFNTNNEQWYSTMPSMTITPSDDIQISSVGGTSGKELIWSNVDVPNDYASSTDIYLKSSEAVIKRSTKYSYNGAILPEIPSDLLVARQYASIWKIPDDGSYVLVVSTKPLWYFVSTDAATSGGGSYTTDIPTDACQHSVNESGDAFDTNGATMEEAIMHTIINWQLVWTNTDIPRGSSTSTEIQFAATNPIPYIEASAATIMIDESYYTNLGDICRARLQVDTKWKPSELPEAIRSLAPLKDATFDRTKITNGVVYYTANDSDVELIGDIMTPGCCVGMTLPDLSSIPGKYTTIGDYAFAGCTIGTFGVDKDFVIEEGVTVIGHHAFSSSFMDWGGSIKLPNGLKTIGAYAFSGTITPFSPLEEVVLPSSLVAIGEMAFQGCNPKAYIVPSSVTSIGMGTFYGSSYLEKIDFSANVTKFPASSLYSCPKLTTLILRKTNSIYTCQLDSYMNIFGSSDPIRSGTGYIYVPKALLETYKAHEHWSGIASQFRAIEDYPDICGTT